MANKYRQITIVEVIVTYISVGWAVAMFTNGNLFQLSENFEVLEFLAKKEWVIGIVCLIIAGIKIIGMALNNIRLRWFGLVLSSVFWALASATFLLSADKFSMNTGFIVYSGIAVLSLWTSKEVIKFDRAK